MLSKETARRFFDIEEVHRVNLRMDTQFRKSLREVINLAADCTTACPLSMLIKLIFVILLCTIGRYIASHFYW